MTRIITIISGKGGVGKTTLVANLGALLASMGKDIIIFDTNLTTPNLGLHLGIPLFPITLHDVLKGNANIKDAVYWHESGLKIVPAGLSLKDLRGVDVRELPNALLDLLGSTEIILLDASAGLGRETLAAMESSDEIIIVTNPDLPSVTDALKAAKLAEQIGIKVSGVVINRRTGKDHEMKTQEIASMLDGLEILAEIPEDIAVQRAISKRIPVVHYAPKSPASKEIKKLAARLIGQEYKTKDSWYRKLFGFILRR
ncbi:MAG: cell division ATPase MinD [Candidatus Aenigmatarchaeota archaeon]